MNLVNKSLEKLIDVLQFELYNIYRNREDLQQIQQNLCSETFIWISIYG